MSCVGSSSFIYPAENVPTGVSPLLCYEWHRRQFRRQKASYNHYIIVLQLFSLDRTNSCLIPHQPGVKKRQLLRAISTSPSMLKVSSCMDGQSASSALAQFINFAKALVKDKPHMSTGLQTYCGTPSNRFEAHTRSSREFVSYCSSGKPTVYNSSRNNSPHKDAVVIVFVFLDVWTLKCMLTRESNDSTVAPNLYSRTITVQSLSNLDRFSKTIANGSTASATSSSYCWHLRCAFLNENLAAARLPLTTIPS